MNKHFLPEEIVRFLKEVWIADLVMPGRRIDVPAERLRLREFSTVSVK